MGDNSCNAVLYTKSEPSKTHELPDCNQCNMITQSGYDQSLISSVSQATSEELLLPNWQLCRISHWIWAFNPFILPWHFRLLLPFLEHLGKQIMLPQILPWTPLSSIRPQEESPSLVHSGAPGVLVRTVYFYFCTSQSTWRWQSLWFAHSQTAHQLVWMKTGQLINVMHSTLTQIILEQTASTPHRHSPRLNLASALHCQALVVTLPTSIVTLHALCLSENWKTHFDHAPNAAAFSASWLMLTFASLKPMLSFLADSEM